MKTCVNNHYQSGMRMAMMADQPTGLCSTCIRDRGYDVQRSLGSGFRGRVLLDDGIEAYVSTGWTNAGFRGIEFYDISAERSYNAGRIVKALR